MIFEIGIVNDHQICIDMIECRSNRRAFPLVLLVTDKDPFKHRAVALNGISKALNRKGGTVRRAVVNYNDSNTAQAAASNQELQSCKARLDQMLFVEDWNDYGKRKHGTARGAGRLIRHSEIQMFVTELLNLGARHQYSSTFLEIFHTNFNRGK